MLFQKLLQTVYYHYIVVDSYPITFYSCCKLLFFLMGIIHPCPVLIYKNLNRYEYLSLNTAISFLKPFLCVFFTTSTRHMLCSYPLLCLFRQWSRSVSSYGVFTGTRDLSLRAYAHLRRWDISTTGNSSTCWTNLQEYLIWYWFFGSTTGFPLHTCEPAKWIHLALSLIQNFRNIASILFYQNNTPPWQCWANFNC